MNTDEVKKKIISKLPKAKILITDMTGDGSHLKVYVEDESFAGISILQQQRIVYDAVGSIVGKEIHAFSLITSAPK